jgi:Alg9-like mannosyltransferase family
LQVKNKFDRNVVFLTTFLTISFMIRNTSPIGWPPLLLIKILYEGSLIPLIYAGILVFLPVVGLCILVDSFYYGQFPVVTAYNFVRANLAEGLSKYFGTEPFYFYIFAVMPLIFTALYPTAMVSFFVYGRDMLRSRAQIPYMLILSGFYILVFSIIAHKEPRFLLPIVPFVFLMIGYTVDKGVKQSGQRVRNLIKAYVIVALSVEVVMSTFFLNMQFRNWEVLQYLQDKEVAPHSIFSMQALDSPVYSWTHRHTYRNATGHEMPRTIVYRSNKNPTYARRKQNVSVPILHDHDFNSCFELISDI